MKNAAVIVDKHTGEAAPASNDIIKLVIEAMSLDEQTKPAQKRLTEIKDELKTLVPADHTVIVDGVGECPITLRTQLVIADSARLHMALGSRFDDLVDMRLEYQPSAKLIEMASDADHPLSPVLRECLEVKETLSISFKRTDKADKKKKAA